ncbi:MAG: hypothetical protein RLP15_13200 [Cryomorphaceae bacterium]
MPESIPVAFQEALTAHFGIENANRVLAALQDDPSTSVRLNPHKPGCGHALHHRVPWTDTGYLLMERPNFAQDPYFHAGAYYVQDSSSMVLESILRKCSPNPQGTFLDACAAPGGKSTIILDYLNGDGFLVANEIDGQRNAILRENLLKWGHLNVGITSLDPSRFAAAGCAFDMVLIDAPCSGEGMFRKDHFARKQWSQDLVDSCATTQRRMLNDLVPTVKKDGLLIYSTCTMNPTENELQIASILDSGAFEVALPDMNEFENHLIPAQVDGQTLGYYLLPGISTGEGLFISVLRRIKTAELTASKSINHRLESLDAAFLKAFSDPLPSGAQAWEWKGEVYAVTNAHYAPDVFYKRLGLPVYTLKGKDVVPLHGLAMIPNEMEALELDLENALRYLRKESFYLPVETRKGWHLVAYKGMKLGWVKALGTRTNNYYPNGLRLRK